MREIDENGCEMLMEPRRHSVFWDDFADELDLRTCAVSFPDWIYSIREEQLYKISPKLIKFCRLLKYHGLSFKIKYPIERDGKWKFADVYIPSARAVVNYVYNCRPFGLPTARSEFFRLRYRVFEIESSDSEERLISIIHQLR